MISPTLRIGSTIGVYEIRALIGAGGMGEVYRARDTRLHRDVALKIVTAPLAADADRADRFDREARVLASLAHPHIATLFGIEESGAVRALVMELVDGATLADRLARGPIPVPDALAIARQLARALECAHERQIVHRDLKPANIKITDAGVVKVLDFGLAKALADASDPGSSLVTRTGDATMPGAVLGTPAYMSPEQARGQSVEREADIWAFGAVLYEMLTGRRPFPGATATDTIAALLERQPDWRALPASTPHAIERLLRRCLEKDARRRLHDIADARIEIEDELEKPGGVLPPPVRDRSARRWFVYAALTVVVVAVVGISIFWQPGATPGAPATRLSLTAPGVIQPQIAPAVSPDGRRIALVASDNAGPSMLWVRHLDAGEARRLDGTEDARHPFWSPDGRSIGFWAGGRIKRVELDGGLVRTLAEPAAPWGGSWSRDGRILFTPRPGALAVVSAEGGPTVPVNVSYAYWPKFLPDGVRFLYAGVDEQGSRGAYVGSLDTDVVTRIMQTALEVAYAEPGWLLFVRDETLLAQRFDPIRLQLSGEPTVVAEGVFVIPVGHRASFSVSDTGVLAFVNAAMLDTRLALLDRSGRSLGTVGAPARMQGRRPQLSPDGRRVALERGTFAIDEDIWLFDIGDGSSARFTFDGGGTHRPVWSADSRRILYRVARPSSRLVIKDVDPPGPGRVVTEIAGSLMDWSPDGRHVIYTAADSKAGYVLWARDVDGNADGFALVRSASYIAQAQFAPNGRWVAYTSLESGRNEVYAVSFPEPSIKRQLSNDGGLQPRWRGDGSELFYVAIDQNLVAVPVIDPVLLRIGPPQTLFRTRLPTSGAQGPSLYTLYDVSSDGQRFVMNLLPEDPGPPFTVVLNWHAGLHR